MMELALWVVAAVGAVARAQTTAEAPTTLAAAAAPEAATTGPSQPCSLSAVDLVIVSEGFFAQSADDYAQTLDFVQQLSKKVDIDGGQGQVGYYHFKDVDHQVSIDLHHHQSHADLAEAIGNSSSNHFSALDHDLVTALEKAVLDGFRDTAGDRAEFKDVIVLLTDGADKRGGQAAVDGLKVAELAALHSNISVVVVGVGPAVVQAELEAAAGDPRRVKTVDSALAGLAAALESVCETVATAKPEVTCMAHADHFEAGFTKAQCRAQCERATFADQSEPCQMVGVDLLVAMAGFAQTNASEFESHLGHVRTLLEELTSVNEGTSQIALMAQQEKVDQALHFTTAGSIDDVLASARAFHSKLGGVDLAALLRDAVQHVFGSANGHRADFQDVVVLFTDNTDTLDAADMYDLTAASMAAAQAGIEVYAVGTASADKAVLAAAAGSELRVVVPGSGDSFSAADAVAALHSVVCRRVMEPADQADCLVSPYYVQNKTECHDACAVSAYEHDPARFPLTTTTQAPTTTTLAPVDDFTIVGASDANGGPGGSGSFASMVTLGSPTMEADLRACQVLCTQAPLCKGLLYEPGEGRCTLASALSTSSVKDWTDDSSKDTYVRLPAPGDDCAEYQVTWQLSYLDFRGTQEAFTPTSDTKRDCGAKCQRDPDCRGFFFTAKLNRCGTFTGQPGGAQVYQPDPNEWHMFLKMKC